MSTQSTIKRLEILERQTSTQNQLSTVFEILKTIREAACHAHTQGYPETVITINNKGVIR